MTSESNKTNEEEAAAGADTIPPTSPGPASLSSAKTPPISSQKKTIGHAPRTPARNNYAAPHTPIASAKRPRSNTNNNSSMLSPGGVSSKGSQKKNPSTPLMPPPMRDESGHDGDEDDVDGSANAEGEPTGTESGAADDDDVPQTPVQSSNKSLAANLSRRDSNLTQLSPMHPARPLVIHEDVEGEKHDDLHGSISGGENGSWVGRKVDALFSPVLSFLSGTEGEEGAEGAEGAAHEHEQQHEQDHQHEQLTAEVESTAELNDTDPGTKATAVDDDEEYDKPPGSDTTSHTTSQGTTSHDEADYDDDHDADDDAHYRRHAGDRVEDDVGDDEVDEHHHHHHLRREEDEYDEYDESERQDEEEEDEEDEFNPYVFIKSLPNYDLVAPLRPPIALPEKLKSAPPISLVLDLDETLVHCTVEPVDDADLIFPVVFHGMTYQVHVRLRPHLFEFLEKIKGRYEVIVFTASQKVYANELLNLIDPEGKYIHHRMFRESCLAVEGNFLKDLNVLGRDLSKCLLVDNSPHAFGYQVDNGIPIESWFDDPKDTELLKLERFLRTLHGTSDVRKVIRKTFQTYRLVEES